MVLVGRMWTRVELKGVASAVSMLSNVGSSK